MTDEPHVSFWCCNAEVLQRTWVPLKTPVYNSWQRKPFNWNLYGNRYKLSWHCRLVLTHKQCVVKWFDAWISSARCLWPSTNQPSNGMDLQVFRGMFKHEIWPPSLALCQQCLLWRASGAHQRSQVTPAAPGGCAARACWVIVSARSHCECVSALTPNANPFPNACSGSPTKPPA